MQLLLSREPTDGDKRILLATGIRTDRYLIRVQIEAQRTPIELVVDTGGIIFRTERVYGPSSPLLDALKGGRSLTEAVRVLSDQGPAGTGGAVGSRRDDGRCDRRCDADGRLLDRAVAAAGAIPRGSGNHHASGARAAGIRFSTVAGAGFPDDIPADATKLS